MSWYPDDVPAFPFKKPRQVEEFEQLSTDQLNSMVGSEVKEKIDDVAFSIAKTYEKQQNSSYEGCVSIVSEMLMVTGGAINHKVGQVMVGSGDSVARRICSEIFPEDGTNS